MGNAECPFSHDPLDAASAVDLRCGHRFALACLGVARHAAQRCGVAGHSQLGALICPLCGDQDSTSKPGASKTLTTYSSNTDAYLGNLRKDWQRPLHLPSQADPSFHATSNGAARTSTAPAGASRHTKEKDGEGRISAVD